LSSLCSQNFFNDEGAPSNSPWLAKRENCLFLGFDFGNWQISFFEKRYFLILFV
jgi:hypothetical protein